MKMYAADVSYVLQAQKVNITSSQCQQIEVLLSNSVCALNELHTLRSLSRTSPKVTSFKTGTEVKYFQVALSQSPTLAT